MISNTAGGCSFYRDARLRRLTRYRHNDAPFDLGGRYLYLRDDLDGDYWSPSWQPTRSPLDAYECRHGLSYTSISSRRDGIHAEMLYFVPLGETLEVWRLRVRNDRAVRADLSVFSSVEFCLWDAQDDATNFQRNYSVGEVEVVDGVIYHKTEYRERRNHFAYFACSEPLAGFDTQRDTFLGPYRGWDSPSRCRAGQFLRLDRPRLGTDGLAPRPPLARSVRDREVIFVLGYSENPADEKFDPPGSQTINKARVRPVIERWLRTDEVERAFGALKESWDELLSVLQVETPDRGHRPDGEHLEPVPVHGNVQPEPVDVLLRVRHRQGHGVSRLEPGHARLRRPWSPQGHASGSSTWPPPSCPPAARTTSTSRSPSGATTQIGSGFNDDPLWLVLAVSAYLKETGDLAVLDELVPYDNCAGSEPPLLEHLHRCMRYTLDRLGPHGLPLIGHADWNDCLNLNCFSRDPWRVIPDHREPGGRISPSRSSSPPSSCSPPTSSQPSPGFAAPTTTRRIARGRRQADGRHDRRARLGRRVVPPGLRLLRRSRRLALERRRADLRRAARHVRHGGGRRSTTARRRLALDSVQERLATEHGIMLIHPPFTRYHLELGEITSYPPGYKENGSIFCHVNPWIMIAETMLGDGEAAFDYYKRTNPSARAPISDVHRCEPYVYAQTIAGPATPPLAARRRTPGSRARPRGT